MKMTVVTMHQRKLIGAASLMLTLALPPMYGQAAGIDIHVPIPPPPSVHVSVPGPPHVRVGFPLPPPLVVPAPPRLVVLPESHVYVAPDIDEEVYFTDGWWWRRYDGRWYRSRHHHRGWAYYGGPEPRFYTHIHPGWRDDYRAGQWHGRPWAPTPMPHAVVQKNWRGWERDRHWERHGNWGVGPHPGGPHPGGPHPGGPHPGGPHPGGPHPGGPHPGGPHPGMPPHP
jgi:hypothetical protein